MKNEPITLKGYSAAKFIAETKSPLVKPGNLKITTPYKILKMEDATEEQIKKLIWLPYKNSNRALIPLTKEEKAIRKENQEYHKEQTYLYLLDIYGWEYAERYAKEKNIKLGIELPHCKYNSGQCDIFCNFYTKEKCNYKDIGKI